MLAAFSLIFVADEKTTFIYIFIVPLTLKQVFWNHKSFSKNWNTVFQLKLLKLKSTIFPHKPAMSETNVKINKIGNTK